MPYKLVNRKAQPLWKLCCQFSVLPHNLWRTSTQTFFPTLLNMVLKGKGVRKIRKVPEGSKWGGACEQWWLYWTSWTAASLIIWCKGSQLLVEKKRERNVAGMTLRTDYMPVWINWLLTLLFSHSPHHDVHTGSVGLTAQFERAQFTLEILNIV